MTRLLRNTAKVIQLMGKSVIPAIKVFRVSMDKNTLILLAIYGTFCIYTNLRVFSSYPSVVFVKYFIEQRKNVCRSNGFSRTSARTLLFKNDSDGAKYKGKFFFSSKPRVKDLRFYRKFCRETTIDVRSEINSWIEQNSHMVKYMWTLYNDSKAKRSIFDISNINKIRKLVMDYNYIQSLLVIKNLQSLKT
jgi:hypothetical protein